MNRGAFERPVAGKRGSRSLPPERAVLDLGPDSDLLSLLVQDGRTSYEELGARTGSSRQTVWRKVQALLGVDIWGFTTVVDHQNRGWRRYMISIPGSPDYDTIKRVEEAEAAVAASGRVFVLQSCLVRGESWRLVVQVATKNSLAMEMFLQALRDRFPGGDSTWQVDEVEFVVSENGFPNPRKDSLRSMKQERGRHDP
jgi:DNA-binding Lrp family transcriptional regulator